MSRILVTGGCGYVGIPLVRQLAAAGHDVTVYDILYFGNLLHPNFKVIQGDIRDTEKLKQACEGHDIFISLACISNDASFELDERLSTSTNFGAFEPMVVVAKRAGIQRFIYASTSSVYGVSDKLDVTEDHPLVPLTLYNKYKAMCEPILLKHTDDNFTGVIFRPATVCGYAPRLRLDLSVNIFTYQAVAKRKLTVYGGSQLRPNLHVKDYADVVQLLAEAPKKKVANQIFNVGAQNMSIMEIALLVANTVGGRIELETQPSNDLRSYHINSDKIKSVLGFVPKHTVEDAIKELVHELRRTDLLYDLADDWYRNVRQLKKLRAT